jgi:hypothetical protein
MTDPNSSTEPQTLPAEQVATNTPTTTSTGTTPNTNANSSAAANATASTPGIISNVPGQLPGTTLNATGMAAIQNQNLQNVSNPQLTASETATPVNQQVNPNEMLSSQSLDANADQVNTSTGNIQASTVGNTATASQPGNINAAQYSATDVNAQIAGSAIKAVTASLPSDALVSTQLQQLLTPDENGNLPAWVQPAVTAANQFLAGRGISNSTMAGQAITTAILTAAIPVAEQNASAELTAFQQNLTDEQQAAMANGNNFVQSLFTNQAADNAAANFNATSTNQTNQFMASLASQINQFNATQTNAIAQFNSSQTQSAATNSAQLTAQLDQFNANMANQREQFNVQNAIIVQQSNAEYQRAVNTANTAVQNQDNQLNAQNSLNLSDQAMANLQQQFNDEATMLYNSNMTAEEQNYALTYLSQQYGLQNQLDKNITDAQEGQAMSQQIGTLAGNLFGPIAGGIGNAINNVINGSSSSNNSASSGNTNGTPVEGAGGLNSSGTAPTVDSSGLPTGQDISGLQNPSNDTSSTSNNSWWDPTTWFS